MNEYQLTACYQKFTTETETHAHFMLGGDLSYHVSGYAFATENNEERGLIHSLPIARFK